MLDKTLAKALKYSWIIGVLAGLAGLFWDKRLLPAILLGLFAVTFYSLHLNTNISNMTNPAHPNLDHYNEKRILRLGILGVALAIPFIFPKVFLWYGTFLIIMLFRILTVVLGTKK